MPTTEAGPLLEAAPTPNLLRPLPDAAFYAEASVTLGVSADALRKAVTEGVISEFRVNGSLALVWTRDELLSKGVAKPPAPPAEEPPAVVPREPSGDDMLSPRQLSSWLGVDRRTIYRWIEIRAIPQPIRLNTRVLRWRRREIEAALASRRVGYALPEPEALAAVPMATAPVPPVTVPPAPWPRPAGPLSGPRQDAGESPEEGGGPIYRPLEEGDELGYASLDRLLDEARNIGEAARDSRTDGRRRGPQEGDEAPPVADAEVNRPRRRCYDPVRATPQALLASSGCSSETP